MHAPDLLHTMIAGGRGKKRKGGHAEEATPRVLLVSIKAGGTGLNLVGANHVIIADPFFNA